MGWYDLLALTVWGLSMEPVIVYTWPFSLTVTDARVHTATVSDARVHTVTVTDS